MADGPRRVQSGDALLWRAAEWNALCDRIEDELSLTGSGPLSVSGGAGGRPRVLRDATPRPWVGLLAGAGPTYSATELVHDLATGTWVAGARSTDAAIEVGGKTGLAGKRARLHPGPAGEYTFQYLRRGVVRYYRCVTIRVLGCPPSGASPLPLAGATVNLREASSTAPVFGTATTDSGGNVTACGYAASNTSTIWIEVLKARFDRLIGVSGAFNWDLTASAGYQCVQYCPDPYPTTLHGTDANSAFTIAYGTTTWTGQYTWTQAGYARDAYGNCVPATVTAPVQYVLFPPTSPGGPWTLRQQWGVCGVTDAAHFSTISFGNTIFKAATATGCGVPMNLAFTFGADALVPGVVNLTE